MVRPIRSRGAQKEVAATRAVRRLYQRAATESWAMRWPGIHADMGLFVRAASQLAFGHKITSLADPARRLNRSRHALQEGLHTLQFVVEGALERGIARRIAGYVADIGLELGVTPREVAPADDLIAP